MFTATVHSFTICQIVIFWIPILLGIVGMVCVCFNWPKSRREEILAYDSNYGTPDGLLIGDKSGPPRNLFLLAGSFVTFLFGFLGAGSVFIGLSTLRAATVGMIVVIIFCVACFIKVCWNES